MDDGSDANSIAERLGEEHLIDDDDMSTSSVIDISMSKKRAGKQTAFHPSPNSTVIGGHASSSSDPRSPSISSSHHRPSSSSANQIASLRLRLSPLQTMEEPLAQRLGGGMPVADTKGQVFVRTGWQNRATESGPVVPTPSTARNKRGKKSVDANIGGHVVVDEDALLDDVAVMLERSKSDIKALWDNPLVIGLIERRKLKLEEWSEL